MPVWSADTIQSLALEVLDERFGCYRLAVMEVEGSLISSLRQLTRTYDPAVNSRIVRVPWQWLPSAGEASPPRREPLGGAVR